MGASLVFASQRNNGCPMEHDFCSTFSPFLLLFVNSFFSISILVYSLSFRWRTETRMKARRNCSTVATKAAEITTHRHSSEWAPSCLCCLLLAACRSHSATLSLCLLAAQTLLPTLHQLLHRATPKHCSPLSNTLSLSLSLSPSLSRSLSTFPLPHIDARTHRHTDKQLLSQAREPLRPAGRSSSHFSPVGLCSLSRRVHRSAQLQGCGPAGGPRLRGGGGWKRKGGQKMTFGVVKLREAELCRRGLLMQTGFQLAGELAA